MPRRSRPGSGKRFGARFGSIAVVVRSTPRMVPIIGRSRLASSSPSALTTWWQTIAVCREFGVPILSRGGGTSLTGGCCNVAVVMDFSKRLNRVMWDRPRGAAWRGSNRARYLTHLRYEAEKHGLTLLPIRRHIKHCTLGGMVGNNSCGVHSLLGSGPGRTSDQVDELEILLYDGTRLTVGATSRTNLPRSSRLVAEEVRSTPSSRVFAIVMATRFAAVFPRSSRGACRAITSMISSRNAGFTLRGHSPVRRERA